MTKSKYVELCDVRLHLFREVARHDDARQVDGLDVTLLMRSMGHVYDDTEIDALLRWTKIDDRVDLQEFTRIMMGIYYRAFLRISKDNGRSIEVEASPECSP